MIQGVEGFSVSIESPTVSLFSLYNAVFKDLEKNEKLEVTCTSRLQSASESFSIYESVKRIIDGAMTDLTSEDS